MAKTYRYRFVGEYPKHFITLGLENVQPGDIVELNEKVESAELELVKDDTSKPAAPDSTSKEA